jgi:hypothetical protein
LRYFFGFGAFFYYSCLGFSYSTLESFLYGFSYYFLLTFYFFLLSLVYTLGRDFDFAPFGYKEISYGFCSSIEGLDLPLVFIAIDK